MKMKSLSLPTTTTLSFEGTKVTMNIALDGSFTYKSFDEFVRQRFQIQEEATLAFKVQGIGKAFIL